MSIITLFLTIAAAAVVIFILFALDRRARRLEAELRTAAEDLKAWKQLRQDTQAELDEEKRQHVAACALVAKMHAAAVGEVRGPRRGVVEDVEDVRKELEAARAPLQRVPIEGLELDEFRQAFDVDDDQPLWQAVHQLLDQAIVKGVDDITPAPSAVFTAEVRTHSAGELNALREFQRDLLRWQREARRARTAAEAVAE